MREFLLGVCLVFVTVMTAQNPNDCVDAIEICGTSLIDLDPSGVGDNEFDEPGNVVPPCYTFDNQTIWLQFNFVSAGQFTFDIIPDIPNADYDFAIYGPATNCSALGVSIRCSSTNPQNAGISGNTGLDLTSVDVTEGPGALGDGYLRFIDVQAGERYYLVIDRAVGAGGFSLNYTGNAGLPNTVEANDIPDQTMCDMDDTQDGFTDFDLDALTPQIQDGQMNTTVTYHLDSNDAGIGVNPLPNPYRNVGNPQRIYARIENAEGCSDITDFLLRVTTGPSLNMVDEEIICSQNTTETYDLDDIIPRFSADTNLEFTYHTSQVDAESGNNPIGPSITINQTPQEVFVRVTDPSNPACASTSSCLVYVDTVTVNPIMDLLQCDDDGTADDMTAFDLDALIPQLIGTQTDVSVTFHDFGPNAESGINPLTSPHTNVGNPQIIHARIFTTDGCFETTSFNIEVSNTPSLLTPENVIFCSTTTGTNEVYTLDDIIPQVITDPSGFVFTYHNTQAEADDNMNDIGDTITVTETLQTVYVRVTDENADICYNTVSFDAFIDVVTANMPSDLEQCDSDGVVDGQTTFDLSSQDSIIMNGQTGTVVTYHTTMADASSGDNDLPSMYMNNMNPETIFARIESQNGCFDTTSFEIEVSDLPTVMMPAEVRICSPNPTEDFILDDIIPQVVTDPTGFIFTYHDSQQEADNNMNDLGDIAQITPNTRTIFIRVTADNDDQCYNTTMFDAVLFNVVANTVDNQIKCDNVGSEDGMTEFDLDALIPQAQGTQTGVIVTFHDSPEDAESGDNDLVSPYTNTSNPQVIYVRVEGEDMCYGTSTFTLQTGSAFLNEPERVEICSDNPTEQYVLDDIIPEVLDDPTGLIFSYHNTQTEADNDLNDLSPEATITETERTIFIRVEDENDADCFSTVSFNAIVFRNPEAEQAPDTMECVDDINGMYQFDLTVNDMAILNGNDTTDHAVFYYTSINDRDMGVNATTIFTSSTTMHTIYARLINDNTTCFDDTQFNINLIQNPMPEFQNMPYVLCENEGSVLDISVQDTFDYYEWSTGEEGANLSSITITQPGTYSVTVTNGDVCSETISTTIVRSEIAQIVDVDIIEFSGEGNTITVTASGNGDFEYALDDGAFQQSNVFTNLLNGVYTVSVRDSNGCGISTQDVLVLDYPRFFTPNADGFNDTWRITGIETLPASQIHIFDRYGKLLKQISPGSTGWDGTYNGRALPSNDYWFSLVLQDGRQFKKSFSLKR